MAACLYLLVIETWPSPWRTASADVGFWGQSCLVHSVGALWNSARITRISHKYGITYSMSKSAVTNSIGFGSGRGMLGGVEYGCPEHQS